jgi:hypothetical protein
MDIYVSIFSKEKIGQKETILWANSFFFFLHIPRNEVALDFDCA